MKLPSARSSWKRRSITHDDHPTKTVDTITQSYLPSDLIFQVLTLLDEDRSVHHAPWLFTKTVLQPTLLSLCLLNREWNKETTRLLYKHVFIANPRSLTLLSLTLLKRKHLRKHLHSIFFTRAYLGSGNEWRNFGDWWDLKRVYEICPNIQSWTAKARTTPGSRIPKSFLIHELRRHLSSRRRIGIERLTRLELQAFNCAPDVYLSPILHFPVLEDLTLKGFTEQVTSSGLLNWPQMPRLHRLCLFQCRFTDDTISLPPSSPLDNPTLRALEIIGGSYMSENIWSEIIRIGANLELLTFAPTFHTQGPFNNELAQFPSLVLLRLDVACFVHSLIPWTRPVSLPPRLVHLVTFETQYNSNPSLAIVQDCVLQIVKTKKRERKPSRCKDLQTIRVNATTLNSAKERQAWLCKEAESAGITFSLSESSTYVRN